MKTVIEMAREAGLIGPEDTAHDIINYGLELWISGEGGMQTLERFAELVRADERNRVWTQDHWTEYERSIAAAEREACARIAEEPSATTYECAVACGGPAQTFMQRMPKDAHEIAKQIRARSNT